MDQTRRVYHNTMSELIRRNPKRTQERLTKIQEYTQKLKKAEGIVEFENEPAFVRRNISIQQSTPSTEERFSRFGLSQDEDGRVGLRTNNFLHDNVD